MDNQSTRSITFITLRAIMEDVAKAHQIEVILQAPESGIEQAIAHYGLLTQFVSRVLKNGIDYGTIPKTKKPTLYKAGAEKICQLFNLRPEFVLVKSIEDWTGKEHGLNEPLFFYSYQCILHYPKINGHPVGEGTGSCNSLENKYRGENWRFDLVNTIDKMGQKRSLVAAVLITCGASEYFTQDIEDWQQTVNGSSDDPNEKEVAITTVGELIKNLGWTIEQAQGYLRQHYGVTGRKQLSVKQLKQLIERLTRVKAQN